MRGKNFAELLGRQETQGPFAAGGGRGEAGALAGDGVGQGLPSSPGIQDRKPTLDSEPRWVSPTKGQKRV